MPHDAMENEKQITIYARKIARVLLKVILFLFLFVVFVVLMVLTPPVQRYLTGKAETYLQKKLQTRVEIGRISFGLSGNINLENVYVEDRSKDTLVAGGLIKAHLNYFRLLSNEVQVKDLELQNITAKVKRVLPDTVFNYQFVVDAFVTEQSKSPDTAQTAPLKLDISDLALDNVNLRFVDAITGNDMFAHIGNLSAAIDSLDPYQQHYDIPTIIARNVTARIKQIKPLVKPEPVQKDVADALQPSSMKLNLGDIELSKINIDYANDVSAFYTTLKLGQVKAAERQLDLQHNKISLDDLELNNSKIVVRLGEKEEARVVKKEAKQEVQAQKQAGWDFRIAQLQLKNNDLKYDDDNEPKQPHGMDYAHLAASDLSLKVNDFVMNTDTVAANITEGSVKEQSGFELDALHGNVVYTSTGTYVNDLYIKTPGSQIQRNAELKYASLDALTNDLAHTAFNVELVNSRVQVKDILVFAPQLRNNPALANPDDIWRLNVIASGTLNNMSFQQLQFSGLKNTQLDANGTLAGLMNPQQAGGNFHINKLHTTQTDIELLTGQSLSNEQLNLPAEMDANGSISGNAGRLHTQLNIHTSSGFVALNGNFSNLTNPASTRYDASIRTSGLQLGRILRQQNMIGSVTGNFLLNGRGLTPENINTKFIGNISSVGYNNYQYHNIKASGSLRGTNFNVNARVNDPNADLDLVASGNFSGNPAFSVNGMVDSIKLQALNFTTDPLIFRGQIDASAANLDAENPDLDVLITNALVVSNNDRLPLDTVQLLSGRNDTANYIRLRSDIANAMLTGQYRLAELASILQNTVQPYFTVTKPSNAPELHPYDFTLTADVQYTPILSSFVPGLTNMQTIHADGSFASGGQMNARVTTPYILYNGNEMQNVDVTAFTSADGLQVRGNIARLKSGNSFDVYNARVQATALNNNIDFSLGIDDQNAKNKYHISGLVTQPATGTYSIQLRPDSLMLNYEMWSVNAGNRITIKPDAITASNFVLQNGNQRLSLNSIGSGSTPPLQVGFEQFRLATITGFVKADSVLVDGLMNGNLTFPNIMKQAVFTSDLTINDLSMRQDTLGDVRARVSSDGTRYNTDIALTGRGNDASITGSFTPIDNDVRLDLNVDLGALQLNTLQGVLMGAISNASGAVNGNVRIAGTTSNPDINGKMNFDNASFALTMLGTQFKVDNEQLAVTEDGFAFDNFTIRDSANNTLTIDGNVLTSNFINYNFNLDVHARDFLVLNSTKTPDALYYGKLNISADAHIAGTEVKPIVDGSLTVNDGTNMAIVIPQESPQVEARKGIVEFVDMDAPENDSLFIATDSLNKANVLGMDITANIEIKKEAIFNIIVDPANGDFLNLQGEAVLSTGIDPSGKITLVGNYSLVQGSYQISFNFLQRKFDIVKGSSITWTGEPTTAKLNVDAVYIANTAPIDLMDQQITDKTAQTPFMQKLPFQVHLSLTGELMHPIIDFDITLPPDESYGVSNDVVTAVESKLQQVRQDEGEVNKQVFALLLLGRFVGENPFKSSGPSFSAADYARQSVSRLLTEQLNDLAADLIQGVDINFDVVTSNDYTTGERQGRTDLNVGVSKQLLNDRLKVSVGNNFQLQGAQPVNKPANNLVGNLAIDYQLSRSGRYMLRFYRRNEFEGLLYGYIVETGLSFIISADYEKIMDLLHRKKKPTDTNTNQNAPGQ